MRSHIHKLISRAFLLGMLKNFTDLAYSFVDVKVQLSADIERNSIVAATLILHCHKRNTDRVTLLNRVRDLSRSRINRQIQQSIAALLSGEMLLDFLSSSASGRGHFAHNSHILWRLGCSACLLPCGYLYACVHLG